MSDQNDKLEQAMQNQQAAKTQSIVQQSTIQTAENTVFKQKLSSKNQVLGQWEDKENQLSITGFIGLTKDNYKKIQEELDIWLNYTGAIQAKQLNDREKERQGFTESAIQASISQWEEYCVEHYPDMEMDKINTRIQTIYSFINNIADPMMVQYDVVNEKGLTNQSQRTTNLATSDINGLIPNRSQGKFSLSEFMRRTSMSSSKEPYNYDLLLRNSFVALRYVKPTRLEAGVLIKDINNAIRGHVRTVSQNVPALANMAAVRVMWNFLRNRILMCSVKDTSDFDELADIIRINDINTIAGSFLALFYPQGINFSLSCLGAENCGWERKDIIDPTSMVIARKWLDTDEESAAYANMFNFSRKYSREESLDFIENVNYQRDIEPVWNSSGTACFVLGVPSLTEAFEAEAFFSELIQKDLNELRENAVTEQQYITARDNYLNGLVGTDYLHYIAEYRTQPPEGTDGEEIVIKRAESDPKEFNQGIMNVVLDNEDMGAALIAAIIKHYPYMNKTLVGLANYECENCKAKNENYEVLGYTPINIMSTFFTLASLTFTGRSMVGESAMREALSTLSQ